MCRYGTIGQGVGTNLGLWEPSEAVWKPKPTVLAGVGIFASRGKKSWRVETFPCEQENLPFRYIMTLSKFTTDSLLAKAFLVFFPLKKADFSLSHPRGWRDGNPGQGVGWGGGGPPPEKKKFDTPENPG
jgi:hypothetical protein